MQRDITIKGNGGNETGDCECYYSLYCGFGALCDVNGCVPTSGCGVFGSSNCTGVCDNSLF